MSMPPDPALPVRAAHRPEVDGVRALSILVVLLFHFQVAGFGGGFVGVDVFFVVSGFLITRNLLNDIALERFSLGGFYARRVRRILPSLLVTMALTLGVGVLVLPPRMLADAARSATHALLFVSNVHFWSLAGYFDTSKYTKPFLHTWSLGVEEQYYIVWPFVVAGLVRLLRPRGALLALVVGAIASLAAGAYWLTSASVPLPGGRSAYTDAEDVFYLLPFRMWELALGAALAFRDAERLAAAVPARLRALGASLGAIGVLWATATFTPDMTFPGPGALLPCLSAAAMIALGGGGPLERVSGWRPVRFVGQLSYALYLTHWPVLILWRVATYEKPGPLAVGLLLAASIGSAHLLARWVEAPFLTGRFATKTGMRPAGWALVVGGFAAVLATSLAITAADGLPARMLPPPVTPPVPFVERHSERLAAIDRQANRFNGSTYTLGVDPATPGARRALVMGDSHAGHLAPVLDAIGTREGIAFDAWTFPGCPPVFGTYKVYWKIGLEADTPTQAACRAQVEQWREVALGGTYDLVVIAGRWTTLFEPTRHGELEIEYAQLAETGEPIGAREEGRTIFERRLPATVATLRESGLGVVLVGQAPEPGRMLAQCGELSRFMYGPHTAEAGLRARCRAGARDEALARLRFSNGVLERAGAGNDPGVRTFLASDVLCPEGDEPCSTVRDGLVLYKDDDHLSEAGAALLGPGLTEAIRGALAARDASGTAAQLPSPP
jgi:peptidoglycan/LPS O-acetylase OafA/YrhL